MTEQRIYHAWYDAGRRFERYDLPNTVTRDEFAAVWSGRCFGCGQVPAEGVDHIRSKHDGGGNTLDNIQPGCWPCNHARRNNSAPTIDKSSSNRGE